MRPFWRGLRFIGLWVLPPVVLALVLMLGFAVWCVSSQVGTRWLLQTVVAQFNGQIQGVQGSIAKGLRVGDLSLSVPQAQVHLQDFDLQVLWSALREGRLQVRDLSAAVVEVQLSAPSGAAPGPFQMPVLPVTVEVDRLAVGRLAVQQGGRPLPVEVRDLASAVSLDAGGVALTLQNLKLVHGDTQFVLQAQVKGSLDDLRVQAQGAGDGMRLDLDAQVYPQEAFPLGKTRLSLSLPREASLELDVDPQAPDATGARLVQAQVNARNLNPGPWLPKTVGATLLNLSGSLQLQLTAAQKLEALAAQLELKGPNRWNGSPLSGHVKIARLGRDHGVLFDPQASALLDPLGLTVSGLDIALGLGPDRVEGRGDLSAAASHLTLQARVPRLKALWPGLPGGGSLALETQGSLPRHSAELKLEYVPEDAKAQVPGQAPVRLNLALAGGWSADQGWRGQLSRVDVQHAGLVIRSGGTIPLEVSPTGAWTLGRASLGVTLDGQSLLQVENVASSGSAGQWATQGVVPSLVITPDRLLKIQKWLGQTGVGTGGVRTSLSERARRSRLETRLEWKLAFKGALTGDVRLVRTAGDLTVPADVPVTLGLQAASLELAIRPAGAGTSMARADLQIHTAKLGSLQVLADTPLHTTATGRVFLQPRDVKHVQIRADSDDLAWVNLLLDESIEVGGTVHADVRGQSSPDGHWVFSGPVTGQNLSILSVDQGVRLLQGTLRAHLDGTRAVLDSLRFPAVRRVTPKEWRTATWVSENPDAQGGSLDVSGVWDFGLQQGEVKISPRRYPILQRADRYAMVTGQIDIQASLPRISVSGKIVADAGWFDLDMLNNIPSLDSDVVVIQPGKAVAPAPATPLDLSVDLTVDLGPRFYLTGYGVNSGLIGSLDLHMRKGKLTALGALHTRGGSIDVYGQHLQLRRGTVTFQGNIANPVLSIEALRTGLAVQAGVRVAGTARHPRIDLVSHPDVSETGKLTWLILGHGPNDGGGDMSLLFSVGSSFLSGGEPFYKRFGLDELSIRSGELGATGSVLPVQSVVTDLDTGASPAEQRFVVASKTLTDNVKVSLEQALAQTGTVARLSYRILRRLQAEVTVGTVSGLALVYRWFSMD
ncbi:MAG TPA: translocation/assembly module TamB domain-containing protein [Castellaniella sp.]|uniref:translocation/assembly module TamB domain-containing protein n=1 Tax=Castellaniella sp. TaxID=1955812 RepID=UPI002F046608